MTQEKHSNYAMQQFECEEKHSTFLQHNKIIRKLSKQNKKKMILLFFMSHKMRPCPSWKTYLITFSAK